jgi:hypothetical protein
MTLTSIGFQSALIMINEELFLVNHFDSNKLQQFTTTCLKSSHKQDESQAVTPPYRITFTSITSDVRPITNNVQKIDVRHMNAYQVIPGIMYAL